MGIYEDLAKTLPTPRILVCNYCKKEKPIAIDEARDYLKNGWPKCCDNTMSLQSQNNVKLEE